MMSKEIDDLLTVEQLKNIYYIFRLQYIEMELAKELYKITGNRDTFYIDAVDFKKYHTHYHLGNLFIPNVEGYEKKIIKYFTTKYNLKFVKKSDYYVNKAKNKRWFYYEFEMNADKLDEVLGILILEGFKIPDYVKLI